MKKKWKGTNIKASKSQSFDVKCWQNGNLPLQDFPKLMPGFGLQWDEERETLGVMILFPSPEAISSGSPGMVIRDKRGGVV